MLIRRRRGWEIPDREATSEALFMDRRRFLEGATALGGLLVAACDRGFADGPVSAPAPPALAARRSPNWLHDGALTDEKTAARYNNFYEFSQDKDVWRYVEKFETRPWTVEVSGLVGKPKTWDIDQIRNLALEERLYRHRCVEAWYMDVPWIGVPLNLILQASEPLPKARYVRFLSFLKKDQAPGQKNFNWYRWPYYEGLRLDEAMNEMTLATVGIYGHELPKQHGAPFRVVVPWKYGYKGPKSVVKIDLVEKQPGTFWNDLQPAEYSFESNVNPKIPHPRWSQATERSIDGARSRPTRLYNGYETWVGSLYRG